MANNIAVESWDISPYSIKYGLEVETVVGDALKVETVAGDAPIKEKYTKLFCTLLHKTFIGAGKNVFSGAGAAPEKYTKLFCTLLHKIFIGADKNVFLGAGAAPAPSFRRAGHGLTRSYKSICRGGWAHDLPLLIIFWNMKKLGKIRK